MLYLATNCCVLIKSNEIALNTDWENAIRNVNMGGSEIKFILLQFWLHMMENDHTLAAINRKAYTKR